MIEKLKNESGTIEAIVEIKPEEKEEVVEEVVETKKSKPFLPYLWIIGILLTLYFIGVSGSDMKMNNTPPTPNTSPSKVIPAE